MNQTRKITMVLMSLFCTVLLGLMASSSLQAGSAWFIVHGIGSLLWFNNFSYDLQRLFE